MTVVVLLRSPSRSPRWSTARPARQRSTARVAGGRTAGAVRRLGAARRRSRRRCWNGCAKPMPAARGEPARDGRHRRVCRRRPLRRRRHRRYRDRGRRRRVLDADVRQAGRARPTRAGRRRQAGRRIGPAARTDRGGEPSRGHREGRRTAPLAAVGGQPRPAHTAGRREGRRIQPARRDVASPPRTPRNCWPPSRSPSTS